MKTLLVVVLIALSLAPLAPAEAGYSCLGRPEQVAFCESWGPGYNCFYAYVLGENVHHSCLA